MPVNTNYILEYNLFFVSSSDKVVVVNGNGESPPHRRRTETEMRATKSALATCRGSVVYQIKIKVGGRTLKLERPLSY